MDINEVAQALIKRAKELGATEERAADYAKRAVKAYHGMKDLTPPFIDRFNSRSKFRISLDKDQLAQCVHDYFHAIIEHKMQHRIHVNDRIDTHICAGLWFCSIVQNPFFGFPDDDTTGVDTASDEEVDAYHRLRANFAFLIAIRVLRGHFKRHMELPLFDRVKDLRKYISYHYDEIGANISCAVAIFFAISIFDENPSSLTDIC